ncbi:MAG TPA: Mur ligase family protein, partial [Atopostipes sp.]|nr:Mur ligase family protein [Atopostipes sp.]
FTQWFLKTFTNGGSSLPGKVATRINPDLLKELAEDYEVVMITGTNGKTVTTSLTVNILKQKYDHVLTNDTGSNMLQGVVSSFLEDAHNRKKKDKIAVLEVDEASLRRVTEYIKPKAILVTNIFPDQMDRHGSPEAVYNLILEGAAKAPDSLLMLNGDAPILNSQLTDNPKEYFGFDIEDQRKDLKQPIEGDTCPKCGTQLQYKTWIYSNLGDYHCPNCDLKRPELSNKVEDIVEMNTESATFLVNGYKFTIPVSGLYNVYNALSAYTIGRYFNVSENEIAKGLNTVNRMFGRQELIEIDGKEVHINLVKNAVGLNEVINLLDLETEDFTLVTILNDNLADGRDISWIQDGDFEKIIKMPVKDTFVSGTRKEELTDRLVKAGFAYDALKPLEDSKAIIEAIKKAETDKVYILTTYTSMLDLRKELYEQGYVKDKMKA